jgi:UDP-glucose 4-epimerase
LKNNRILITGVSGYIGSCLFNFFKKKFVYGLDKSKPDSWINIKKKNFFKCNLLNKKKLEKILKKIEPNLIIHLAAKSTVSKKIKLSNYYLNNVVATKNLIYLMKKLKIKKIVYSSTAAIYKSKINSIKETDKIMPISNYGKTKFKAEKIIKKNIKNFVILRFFNVCSSLKNPLIGENHKPETHLIPLSIKKAILNKTIKIFGNNYPTKDGTCLRDYIHIKDICIAVLKSLIFLKKNKNGIFNLGNNTPISNKDVVNQISKILNKKLKIFYENRRNGDPTTLICNNSYAKKKLRWIPKYSNLNKILQDQLYWTTFLIKKNI